MSRLKNKVAIITGGANGIGRAIATRFAIEGAIVVVWDVAEKPGQLLIQELMEKGFQARFRSVNVAKMPQVLEATETVLKEFGRIDILINNAGILRDSSLLKMTEEQFQTVMDVNLTGVFNCTKAIAPSMVAKGYGRIVQSSSIVASNGNFGQTNYVASKAGIVGMTKVWARELGPKGITVNAIAPGFIATDMIATIPEDSLKKMSEHVPLRRMGTVEEVANVFLFLASEESSYVNGAVIPVDGGAIV